MKCIFEIRLKKNKMFWILAAVITALDFLVAVLFFRMSYMTVDDSYIQNILSGFNTGEPYPFHQYINVLLSFFIAGLYKLIPGVQWWYVWSIIALAVGIFLVHFSLLKLASKNKFSWPVFIGIIFFLDVGFFIYPIANINFSIVAAVLGTGIVAGLFWMSEAETVKHEKLILIGSTIGFMLVFCQRRQSGLALLCYILLAFLYYYISRSQNWKKTLIRIAVTVASLVVISETLTVVNRNIQNNHNGQEYVAFNSARSKFLDYPHDTYNENPEIYEAVGWDADTYRLASNLCYLDEKVNAESMSYLSENSQYHTAETNRRELLKTIYHDDLCRSILILFAASILMVVVIFIIFHKKKTLFFLLVNNIGTICLFLYQIFKGRALYHSIIVILLPAVVINIFLSLQHNMGKKVTRNIFSVVLIALGLVCVVPMCRSTFSRDDNNETIATIEKFDSVDSYMAEHEDNFYVRQKGVANDVSPRLLTSRINNSIPWGNASYYSAEHYAHLEANGLSDLTGETFKDEKVYFISLTDAMEPDYVDNGKELFAIFLRYLEKECGAVGFVQEDVITDGAYVYHFVFEENMDEYDTYYNIVDGYTVEVEP